MMKSLEPHLADAKLAGPIMGEAGNKLDDLSHRDKQCKETLSSCSAALLQYVRFHAAAPI